MSGGIGSRALNKLTDVRIRAFINKRKSGEKVPRKLADGGGMYVTLTPAGTPVWRVKYRLGPKEKLYAIGTYPAVSLDAARAERDAIKGQLREGHDPIQVRKLGRADATAAAGHTFKSVAQDWLDKQQREWSPVHYQKSRRAFERDVYPLLGKLPISGIRPVMVSGLIESIIKRGARDTASKVLQHVQGVFRLAQARGLRDDNPADPVGEVLPSRRQRSRMPAVLTFQGLGAILRSAETANLSPVVRMAHRLCAFTAARIGNVADAEWKEFNLDAEAPTWIIPRAKMKSRDRHHDHKIILGPAIAAELRSWRTNTGGRGPVFPGRDGTGRMSREAVEKAYRETLDLSGKHSPHGWRSAFSTLARDHGFDRDAVELTLDHVHDNDVARAYDRGERLEQRIKLMAWWGEQLAQAQRGADVMQLARRA